jgi:hypothetical protein
LQHVEDARRLVAESGAGLCVRIATEEGDPEEEIIRYARERNIDVLLCPPRYKTIIKRHRKILHNDGKEAIEDTVLDETERLKMAVVSMQ